jgi:hypothetical protein
MKTLRTPGQQRSTSAALLCLMVVVAMLFSTAGTSYADEDPHPADAPGVTEISFKDVAFVVDPKTGKTTRVVDNIAAVPSGTETGSGGWARLFEHGCRTVKVTNKKWNYTHTQVLAKFVTHTYWCWDRSDKKIRNVDLSWETDIASATFMSKVGFSHKDPKFYDWASGYAPRSGYDNDMEYHFKNCPLNWSCGHLYLRNILRAHSDGTWTWRTEN